MQETKTSKKLTVTKETLKTLTEKELEQVAGGAMPRTSWDCTVDGRCF